MTAAAPAVHLAQDRPGKRADQGASVSGASSRGSHRLSAALTCERLWVFRYHMDIVPIAKRENQLLGTLVHTVLAYWFADMLKDNRPAWRDETSLEDALEADGRGYPELIERAKEIAAWYVQRASARSWRPLYVEQEFEVRLSNILPKESLTPELADEILTCRTDLVAIWNGEVWIVDHKTQQGGRSGRLTQWSPALEQDYALSLQVLMNLWIVRTQKRYPLPGPVEGMAINRIKRTVPFDEDRRGLPIPAMAYRSAPEVIRGAIRRESEILDRMKRGEKPIPNYSACRGAYGRCDYRNLCTASCPEEFTRVLATEFRKR